MISANSGATARVSRRPRSRQPLDRSVGGPWNSRWYMIRMYSAAKMMPTVAMIPYTRCRVKVPTSTRNSLMNVLIPGSARLASPASRNAPPRMGWVLATPP